MQLNTKEFVFKGLHQYQTKNNRVYIFTSLVIPHACVFGMLQTVELLVTFEKTSPFQR